jgi:predicted nucleotidyltransferase
MDHENTRHIRPIRGNGSLYNQCPDNPGATMRLSPQELDAVRRTLYGADPNGRVWLFGSRADDSRRGGDIDLYLEASQPIDLKTTLALEYRLTSLCDAKVDLLIRRAGEVEQPIHVIARQGVPL